jgi:hypothetical protein
MALAAGDRGSAPLPSWLAGGCLLCVVLLGAANENVSDGFSMLFSPQFNLQAI